MFTAHSSPNINIKDFLLTARNSVFPLKIQEILVCFSEPVKTIKHEEKGGKNQKHNSKKTYSTRRTFWKKKERND